MEESRLIASYKVDILLDERKCDYSQAEIIRELVQRLKDHGEVFTCDQIKHLWRYDSGRYQQAVDELTTKANFATMPALSEDPDAFDYKNEMFDRIGAQIRSLSDGMDYPEFLDAVTPGEWTNSNLQAVDQDYACFELRNPSKGFKPRPVPRSSLPTNRRLRRRFLYARTQTLWKSNWSRCAKSVLSGQWEQTEGSNVPPDKLEAFWWNIFI